MIGLSFFEKLILVVITLYIKRTPKRLFNIHGLGIVGRFGPMQQFCYFPHISLHFKQQGNPKGALNTDFKFGKSCVSSFRKICVRTFFVY